jgi:hypothetical protein
VPELARSGSELLPGLDDFESEVLAGFDLVDESAEPPRATTEPPESSGVGDLHDDPTLLRSASVPPPAPVGEGAAGDAAAGGAGVAAPGSPRGRGLPSGFDEVARAFAEPPQPAEAAGEPARIAPLAMPPAPSRAATSAPVAPLRTPVPPRKVITPLDPPVRRPAPRRRSAFLPLAAAALLLLLTGLGVVYLRFPDLLPEWARAPRLADSEIEGEAEGPRRIGPRRIDPATAGAAAPGAGTSLGGGSQPATASSPPTAPPTAAASASAGTPTAAPPAGDPSVPPRPGAADGAARARFTSVEEIWGQRANVGTVVTIVTNGRVPAEAFSHFRLDGGSPREVIRLRDVDDSYRRTTVPVGTAEVKQVRLGYHARPEGNELHVVLDLGSPRVQLVQLTPVDNRLELVLVPQ